MSYLNIYIFKNYTWSATISMYKLEKLMDWKEIGNGSLITSTDDNNHQVMFNKSNGLATFKNLLINKPGMYVLEIKIKTNDNNDYESICYSNSIQILASKVKQIDYDPNITPEYIAIFDGYFNSIIPSKIESIMYNYITSFGINMAGISCWSYTNQVYVSFYSKDFRSLLMESIVSSGLNVSQYLRFNSITFEKQNFTCLNCSKIEKVIEQSSLPTFAIVIIIFLAMIYFVLIIYI